MFCVVYLESQGDVGVSIMDETTPRSMMSVESSVAEELGKSCDLNKMLVHIDKTVQRARSSNADIINSL